MFVERIKNFRYLKPALYVGVFFVFGLVLLAVPNHHRVFAETCTVTGSGTWDGTANASHGTAVFTSCTGANTTPSTAAALTINSGITLTMTGSASIASLTMANATVANGLIINNGFTLTVSGALTFTSETSAVTQLVTLGSAASGAGNLTVGSISMPAPTGANAASAKITCFASATQTGTLTVSTTGTVAMTGSSTASSTGSVGIDFSTGGCSLTSGTGAITLTGGTVGATPNSYLKMGTGTLTLNGNLSLATNSTKVAFTTVANTNITMNGSTFSTGGTTSTVTITSPTNLTATGTNTISYATAVTTWGTLSVNSGTLNLTGANETFTAITVANGATLNTTKTISNSGNLTCGSGGTSTISGAAGAITMTGASAQLISTGTCNITATGTVTISGATAPQLTSGSIYSIVSLTVSGPFTNNGTLTVTTTLAGASTLTNGSSATLNIGASSVTPTLVASASSNTVNYNGAAQTVKAIAYVNLTLSGSGAKTVTSVTTVNGNFSMSGSATATTVITTIGGNASTAGTAVWTNGAALAITGTLTVGDGAAASSFVMGNFTLGVTGVATVATSSFFNAAGNALVTFNNDLVVNGCISLATGCANASVGTGGITVKGAVSGSGTLNYTGGTFTHSIAASKAFGSSSLSAGWTFKNLTFTASPAATSTLASTGTGTITVTGTMTVSASTTFDGGTGNRTIILSNTGTPLVVSGTLTANTSTFQYTAATATVTATTFNNLTLGGTGTYTLPSAGTTTVAGTFLVSTSATATMGNGAVTVSGDLTATGTLSGAGTGTLTVSGNVTGTGTINLTGNLFEQRVGAAKNFGQSAGSIGWTFKNLTFSNSCPSSCSNFTVTTQSGTGSMTVGGVLTIGKGTDTAGATTTLDAGNRTWLLSNAASTASFTPLVITSSPQAVLTANTSTFQYSGATENVVAATYNNLTLGGTSTYVLPAADITLRGNMVVTTGATVTKSAANKIIFASGTSGQTITGNAINSDLGILQVSANSTATTLTLASAVAATNLIVDASQTFATSTFPLTLSGNLTPNGTVSGTGDITVNGGSVNGTGVVNMTGGTFTLTGTGTFGGSNSGWTFASLTFGAGAAGTTTTGSGAGAITATKAMVISTSQILDAGSKTWNLNGTNNPLTSYAFITSSGTWAGVATDGTAITVEAIGGGGGGGGTGGSGGGGGEYRKTTGIAYSSGATVPVTVGTGGAAQVAGTASNWNSGVVIANGGQPGVAGAGVGNPAGGTGGTGTLGYNGGGGGDGSVAAGAGGGGAAGPLGVGGLGGSNASTGGGGGGNGGGSAGASNGAGGNNNAGTGGGALRSTAGAGNPGTNGGGGGGGFGTHTATAGNGGLGGTGTEWDSTHGSGGGGGGGGDSTSNATGGNGGLYGGGGGGAYAGAGGSGANGIIVVTYHPSGVGTPLLVNGTFTASSSTVNFGATSSVNIPALTYNNVSFIPASGSPTYTAAGAITVNGNFQNGNGTNAVTFVAPSGNLTIAGNFTNNASAIFTHNNGTVIISGAGTHAITSSGSITFNNFQDTTAGNTLTFTNDAGGSTPLFTFAGTVTITGATGNHIIITSNNQPTNKWMAHFNNATSTITHVTVSYSDCDGTSALVTLDSDSTNGTNNGSCWLFPTTITISGSVYSDAGVTLMAGTPTVRIKVNGAGASYTASLSSGTYSIPNIAVATGNIITAYIDMNGVGSVYATTVTRLANTSNLTGLNLWQNYVIARTEDGSPVTNSNMGTYDSASDSDIKVTVSGGNLTVATGSTLEVWSGNTFTPGGTVSTPALNVDGTLSGTTNVTVSNGGVTGNGTINMTGGTFLQDGTGTFGGSNSGWTFSNLTFGDGSGSATTTTGSGAGAITVTGTMTVSASQTLDAGSKTWNLTGGGTGSGWSRVASATQSAENALATTSNWNPNSSCTCTFGASVQVGDRLILTTNIGQGTTPDSVASISDSGGTTTTWTKDMFLAWADGSYQVESSTWSAVVTSAGTPNVTINYTNPTNNSSVEVGFSMAAYRGLTTVSGSGAIDLSKIQANTGSWDSGVTSGTTTAANELKLGIYGDDGWSTTNAVGSPYSLVVKKDSGFSATLIEDADSGSAGSTAQATLSAGGSAWAMGVIVYKLAPSGPLQISSSGTFTANASTFNFTSTTSTTVPATTFNNLNINPASGTQTFTAAGVITVNGNFTNGGGGGTTTFVAPSGNLNIGGNFTNSGTFTANGGTIVFTGTPAGGHVVAGATTFHNVSDIAAGSTIKFTAGQIFTWDSGGVLTITGGSGNNVTVTSTSTARWNAHFTTAQSGTLTNITVQHSGCDTGTATITLDATATNDATATANDTTCWLFPALITISGSVYSDAGSTLMTGTPTVRIKVNGAGASYNVALSSGTYSIPNVAVATGNIITAYIDMNGVGSVYATTVTRLANTSNLTGLNLWQNYIIARTEDGSPVTNSNMGTYDSVSDSDIKVTVSGGNLTVATGSTLEVWSGKTFTPGGTVSTPALNVDGTLSGITNVTVSNGGVTGNGTINMTAGTFLVDAAGNFGGNTAWTFNNLTFGDGAGSVPSCPATNCSTATGSGAITVNGILNVAVNQTLDAGSKTWNLTASGNGNGTITEIAHVKGNGTNTFTTSSIDTTGATLLVAAYAEGNGTPATLSDNKGNTWVLAKRQTSNFSSNIYYAWSNVSVGTGHTFTLTGTNIVASIQVWAFSGTKISADPLDQINGNVAVGSTTLQPGSVTPTTDNQLILAHVETDQGGVASINSGFGTPLGDPGVGAVYLGSTSAYLVQTTAAAVNPTWTASQTNLIGSIATFKPGLGGPLIVSGVLTANSSTFNFAGTSATTVPALTYNNLTFTPASGSPTYTAAGAITANGNFTNGDGTHAVTFVAPSGNFTVGGNFTNSASAVYTANAGSIVFTGAVIHTISSAANITLHNVSDTVDASTLKFKNDATTVGGSVSGTVPRFIFDSGGTLTVTGGASKITVTSDNGANPWLVFFTSAQLAVTNAIISWSDCYTGSATVTLDGTSTNTGNNGTCWSFPAAGVTISGTIYSDDGSTVYNCSTGNVTVRVAKNGTLSQLVTCSAAGGTYTLPSISSVVAGDVLTVFVDSATTTKQGAVITKANDGTSPITINIYQNRVIVRNENAVATTNANLGNYCGSGCTGNNANIPFTYSSGTSAITVSAGNKLLVWTGKTYTPGGPVTTTAASTAGNPDGDILIQASATLSMGTNALSVGGDFVATGTFSKSTGQTTTFTATSSGFTITPNGNFDAVVFNGTGGGWTPSAAMTVDTTLTVTAGTLTLAGNAFTATGATSVTGTINTATAATGSKSFNGGITINSGGTFDMSAVNPATVFAGGIAQNSSNLMNTGSGSSSLVGSLSGTGTGGITFGGALTIPSSTTTNSYTGGTVVVTGTLTLIGSWAQANGSSLTLGATNTPISTVGGTFSASTATNTVTYSGAAETIKDPTAGTLHTYSNLNLQGSGAKTLTGITNVNNLALSGTATAQTAANFVAAGTLTIGSGTTLTQGAFTLEADGTTTVGGTFACAASASTFTLKGDLTISSGGTWTNTNCGTLTFAKGAAQVITDSNTTKQDLGIVALSTNSTSVSTSTNITVTKVSIGVGTTLDISNDTLLITGSGTAGSRPLVNGGTFTTSSSTVDYEGTAATAIETTSANYNNLTVGGTSDVGTGVTYTLNGSTTVAGLLTIGNSGSTNADTFDASSATLTLSGTGTPLTIAGSAKGVFTSSTSTVQYTGATANVTGTTFNNLTLGGTGTYTLPAADITMRGNLVVTTGATVTKSAANKIVFAIGGAGSQSLTGNATNSDLGIIQISANTGNSTLTLGSTVKLTSMTIDASQTFSPGSNVVEFTGTGTPFTVTGTFTNTNSTVKYSGTTATVTGTTYNHLTLGGTGTYTLPAADITLRGNLVVTSGANVTKSAANKIIFAIGGGSTQTLTDSSGNAPDLGIIQVSANSTNSTLSLGSSVKMTSITIDASQVFNVNGSNTLTLTGNGTVLTATGTFTPSTGTVSFVSAATTGTTVPALTYNNLTLNKASNTFTSSSGTLTIGGNLNVTAGTFDLAANDPTTTVTGTTTIAGTLSASDVNNLTLVGDFTNNGTFTHNNGTVVLAPSANTIQILGSSSTSFYNLNSTAAGKTIAIQNGNTVTINNKLTLTGTASSPIALVSVSNGSQWTVNFVLASNNATISFITVKDSACSGNNLSNTLSTNGLNDTIGNRGNNGNCWLLTSRGGGPVGNGGNGGASGGGSPVSGGGNGDGATGSGGGGGTLPQAFTGNNISLTTYDPNWSNLNGTFNLTSNTIVANSADALAQWTAGSFNVNQYSQITISVLSTGKIGVAVRTQNAANSGYYAFTSNSASGIVVVNAGGTTSLYSGSAFASSDILRLEISGTSLTLKKNGNVVTTVTDSTFSAGKPGLYGSSAGTTGDDFYADSIASQGGGGGGGGGSAP